MSGPLPLLRSPETSNAGEWMSALNPVQEGNRLQWSETCVRRTAHQVHHNGRSDHGATHGGEMKIYIDTDDWWIDYYRGSNYHFVCPLPTVVIRWSRRGS